MSTSPASGTFAKLPPGILEDVCKHVSDQSSLRNLRLVCQSFNKASSPFAFSSIHISAFSRSLKNLHALAGSPLARHVTLFEYHPDELPDWTRAEWPSKISDLEKSEFCSSRVESAWNEFCCLRSQQHAWRQDAEGEQLKHYLVRFPNVTEASVQKANRDLSSRRNVNLKPFWKYYVHHTLVGPDDWQHVWKDDWREIEGRNETEGIFTLLFLGAVGLRNQHPGIKPTTTLRLHLTTWVRFDDLITTAYGGTAPLNHAARYESILAAFKPLEFLDLNCPAAPQDTPQD